MNYVKFVSIKLQQKAVFALDEITNAACFICGLVMQWKYFPTIEKESFFS